MRDYAVKKLNERGIMEKKSLYHLCLAMAHATKEEEALLAPALEAYSQKYPLTITERV